jgi:YggT family protein
VIEIIQTFVLVLTLLIVARALMSWIPNLDPRNPVSEFLITVTEPILAPIRAIMPRTGMIDLTPMIAILLLFAISRFLAAAAAGG